MSNLPAFLEPLQQTLPGQPSTEPVHYVNALFRHKRFPSLAHVLYWPSKGESKTCMVFIPGNPGLLDFYTPFLAGIHEKAHDKMHILAHAFVGHTPGIIRGSEHPAATSLDAQIEHVIELIDTIKPVYNKIIAIGHSVGTWVVLQWAFKLPRMISYASVFTRLMPLKMLSVLFPEWPEAQLRVLRSFLDSPSAIYSSLSMADDEMKQIQDLDGAALQQYHHRLHMYFAEKDDWVHDHKTEILDVLQPDPGSVRYIHGPEDIPHAFCINHGEELAEQCYRWLVEGDFVD
ncbi:hypothetical protein PHLCEN_2v8288 [Hermanssonia centrifuga]|uniref:Uncharacterized protein n=1 Tax=Hermanssonia centrifuga TaxID=98765 RepID=A0A2R6NU27_9APHY|nr:hypothetical protein PHLCEN_2v8288 [Hermanssonia centrifuga]